MMRVAGMIAYLLLVLTLANSAAAEKPKVRFNTKDVGPLNDNAPLIAPWRSVQLAPGYSGNWIVTGDVDGDGEADIVTAKNVCGNGIHYTSAAVAQRLDGTIIWRWGDPTIGGKYNGYDVALQIYDWDGDGQNEVILSTKGFLVELDGKTGEERRRIAIPERATDCLVFVNVSGNKRATDVLVKDRYRRIWVYNYEGKQLWGGEWKPGGYPTAHQPRPIDVDGDGKDEILAGYCMLNADGSLRWTYKSKVMEQNRGHLDCGRVLKHGNTPEEFQILMTCCGDNNIACVDGNGKVLWETSGHHFESIQLGPIFPDMPGRQILVDIAHREKGAEPLWVMDTKGTPLGQIILDSSRIHELLDWDGDGFDEILVAAGHGVFNYHGERIATFDTGGRGGTVLLGDMTGNGISDVTIMTSDTDMVYIFENRLGKTKAPMGCGKNFTLY